MTFISIIWLTVFITILLQSDTSNLPEIITAIGTLVGIILTGIVGIIAANANSNAKEAKSSAKEAVIKTDENIVKTDENKAAIEVVQKTAEEVRHTTNSKMDLLLDAKDKEAKAIADAKVLEEAKEAAYNKGLLAAMSRQAKDDLLRNMAPPNMQHPPPPPLTEKLIEKSAEKIADKIVEKSADKIGEKVVDVVVDKVVTEKDDALKKKPD